MTTSWSLVRISASLKYLQIVSTLAIDRVLATHLIAISRQRKKEKKKDGSNFTPTQAFISIVLQYTYKCTVHIVRTDKYNEKMKYFWKGSSFKLTMLLLHPLGFICSLPCRLNPSQMPPKSPYCLHMDTRSGWSVSKYDGSGHPVFCHWLCVAGDKRGSDTSHKEPVIIKRMSILRHCRGKSSMHTINQVNELESNYIHDRSLWDISQEAGNEYLPVVEGCPTPACELMLFVVVPPAMVEWPSCCLLPIHTWLFSLSLSSFLCTLFCPHTISHWLRTKDMTGGGTTGETRRAACSSSAVVEAGYSARERLRSATTSSESSLTAPVRRTSDWPFAA